MKIIALIDTRLEVPGVSLGDQKLDTFYRPTQSGPFSPHAYPPVYE